MSVPPAAELWCLEPHGRNGRPHRLLIARVYRHAGRLNLQLTDRAVHRAGAEDGTYVIGCPQHGAATFDWQWFGDDVSTARGKVRQVRLPLHSA